MSTNLNHLTLTRREYHVLALLCQGKTCKEISRILQLSETTVKTYRERMLLKFEVNNSTELAYTAAKMNIV